MHRFQHEHRVIPPLRNTVPVMRPTSRQMPTWFATFLWLAAMSQSFAQGPDKLDDDRVAFFESKIRPALITHCLECHSLDTELNGGLSLDARENWEKGGDSGEAIVAGHPDKSRLIKAIRYEIPKLQMPPKGRLPKETVEAFEKWIADGAVDPRRPKNESTTVTTSTALTVDRAQEHWAYRPLDLARLDATSGGTDRMIDQFLEKELIARGLTPTGRATPIALVRRLYFDLTGLPPTSHDLTRWLGADGSQTLDYESLVDTLLNSPRFGEHFARKWLDVARYAESVTLRGFVLPQAWRYRDYLIQSYNEDRPFDQMIREQIAGDLMTHDDAKQRSMQLIATGFLALGNTNLEEQDKAQLDMDYIDEQLEVIGNAFLAQTIGCARCHNHKFDPIPTRDYYALAGIMKSAVAMEHENVSKWIEQPLPLTGAEKEHFDQLERKLADVDAAIATLKKGLGKDSRVAKGKIPANQLAGIVIDNSKAVLVGGWNVSSAVTPLVGENYIHDDNGGKGKKTATFEPAELAPGFYQVRLAYAPHGNRATNARVQVFSADGESTIIVNQQLPAPEEGLWISLGKYRFEKDGQAFVLVTNDNSDGVVIADAVQFLPVAEKPELANQKSKIESKSNLANDASTAKEEVTRAEKELKTLEATKKKLDAEVAKRPKYLTVLEKGPSTDIPIHIRGDVHNLGEMVPRGFLSAIGQSGVSLEKPPTRKELADWISSPANPLTARVYANRVWSWLMGQGLVASVNNFGTTGSAPSHPALLDWLANELVKNRWSTKRLVRTILLTEAYQRSLAAADSSQKIADPSNGWYWRGYERRLPVESLRDAMLMVSGELDLTEGGSLIRDNTKADYNYAHDSYRRSVYQPVFRNSLPDLYEAFDFADTSISIGQRPRTTVSTQALALSNSPWVIARARVAAKKYSELLSGANSEVMLNQLYLDCLGRFPTEHERDLCKDFLGKIDDRKQVLGRLQTLIHSLFAAIDFRYLD